MTSSSTPAHVEDALSTIHQLAPGRKARVGLILGSGWSALTHALASPVRIAYTNLKGFPQTAVTGHDGSLWLGNIGATPVAVLGGRQHAYETGKVDAMALPLAVLKSLGCETLVQTNAAGSLRPDMPAQSVMVLTDHLNLPQRSPLVGLGGTEKFVSMVDAYDPQLRQTALQVAQGLNITLHTGVYAWAFGPQFETPAEIALLRTLGAGAVGMSTVPETIYARYLGMKVLAFSLITNMAAGLSAESLSHEHTLAQANAASETAGRLLEAVIAAL
jgi:purine-nucleoside phosphorylase